MSTPPRHLGQRHYYYDLVEAPQPPVRNPGLRRSLRCARKIASWSIIEARAIVGLDGSLVWFERQVGSYHRSSVSWRRIRKLVGYLNKRPLGDYFFRNDKVLVAHSAKKKVELIIIYHKKRVLLPAPMAVKRVRPLFEERVIDKHMIQPPISEQKLIMAEQVLEKNIDAENERDMRRIQQDYYLSLRKASLSADDSRRLGNILLGYRPKVKTESRPAITKKEIANRSMRAQRAFRGISR